jgi:hypothetical protein
VSYPPLTEPIEDPTEETPVPEENTVNHTDTVLELDTPTPLG